MEPLLAYLVAVIWSTHKAGAYFDGRYFVVGTFLFDDAEMSALKELHVWSEEGIIEEMFNRYLSEKEIWQDTITR